MQKQERWIDALADCGRAVAIDPAYAKAASRQATLLERLRRPGAAVKVLLDAVPHAPHAEGGALRARARELQGVEQVATKLDCQCDHFAALQLGPRATVRPCRHAVRTRMRCIDARPASTA